MVYVYEFIVDGKMMRRKAHQFNNGVQKLMAEDIAKLHRTHSTFVLSVKKVTSWKDVGVEISDGTLVFDFKK